MCFCVDDYMFVISKVEVGGGFVEVDFFNKKIIWVKDMNIVIYVCVNIFFGVGMEIYYLVSGLVWENKWNCVLLVVLMWI